MTTFRNAALALTALTLGLAPHALAKDAKKPADNSAYTTAPEPEGTPISKLFPFLGSKKKDSAAASDSGIGVNAYLWRASLDTISFMPLTSADPWGGVIISDWYANPEKTDERFKATIYILDSRLRADALNVNVNKQVLQNGQWVDAELSAQTAIDFENAILTRARQLRLSDVKN